MKIKSKKIVYKCPIFRVEERKVILKDNVEQTHWIVVRQPNVTVVALTNDKRIVLINEIRGKDDHKTIELPGGKLDSYNPSKNEAKKQALQELESEAGFKARNIELLEIAESNSNWRERKYYHFAAWNLSHIGQELEEGEDIKVKLVKVEEAIDIAENRKMTFPDENDAVLKGIEFFKQRKLL